MHERVVVGCEDGFGGGPEITGRHFLVDALCIGETLSQEKLFDEVPGQFQRGVAVHVDDFPFLCQFKGKVENAVDARDGIIHGSPGFAGDIDGSFIHVGAPFQ